VDTSVITSDEIKKRLWDGANELRGSMNASQYMDYMLGLMFYKFLSDKTLEQVRMTEQLYELTEEELVNHYKNVYDQYQKQYIDLIRQQLGYYIQPEYLYQRWIQDINEGRFELETIRASLDDFERTIAGGQNPDDFENLFSSLDLTNQALGKDLNERSKNIKELISLFADLNMVALQKTDVLGDAYEYLIGQFAMEAGKKAGEFYTPRQISEVMAQIVTLSGDVTSVYDPTVGSGSLLLTVKQHLSSQEQKDLNYYGQEKNTATYNLTRMNLLLHGVRPEKMTIRNADTLAQDWPEDPKRPNEAVQFDAIVMNPPYSLKKWNSDGLTISDPRFSFVGMMPPDKTGDYAFLLHGLYHLGQQGTMAIVLPHGVLFRSGAEGAIRQRLIDKNYIDAVIGLPSKLFANTGIAVCIVVLKKNRSIGNSILVIDASKHFTKGKDHNILQDKDIARIVDTYSQRIESTGYSHLVSLDELKKNDYNLNIPRYVEQIETEIPHHVDAHLYGGIPKEDFNKLPILTNEIKDILSMHLKEIRNGYYDIKNMDTLRVDILDSASVEEVNGKLNKRIEVYVEKYWENLKSVNEQTGLAGLKSAMLADAKHLFMDIKWVDSYEAYQVVAELWNTIFNHDLEIIAASGFYESARMTEPNMVSKGQGKNKRMVQEGVRGSIIPNDLIEKILFSEKKKELEVIQVELENVGDELSELVEAAKVEESDEYYALNDLIKRNDEGETTETFDAKLVKKELKNLGPTDDAYQLVKQTNDLLEKTKKLKKISKNNREALNDEICARFGTLTHDEIEQLLRIKWFGSFVTVMTDILRAPILKEIDTLLMLKTRYSDTVQSLDAAIDDLEKSIEDMMKELVLE
jgi:type I restriction system adenine methylase (hsdM)